jgi:hypothetical protein
MSNPTDYNYSNIENPYNDFLERTSDSDGLDSSVAGNVGSSSDAGGQNNPQEEKIIGSSLDNLWIKSWIKSVNYKPKTIGFYIDGLKGYIECMDLYVKGTITGSSLDIPNDSTVNSFHVDVSGNAWWGSILIGDAVAKVLNTGAGIFSNITITGGSVGGAPVANIGYIGTTTADAVPSSLSCSSTTAVVASDGSVSSSVVLTWTALSTNTFDHYQIRFKKAANTYYTYIDSKTNTITIEGLVPNTSYNFGIASVNKYGSASAFSSDISQTTATSTTAPATVSTGSATAVIQAILVKWTHNTESDLASYNIYRHTANDSGAATLIGNCRTNYFIDGNLTGDTPYYFWIKAINTSGLLSASFSTEVHATPRNVGASDITNAVITNSKIDVANFMSVPSDENLVGYWSMDDGAGAIVKDTSQNANNGTINGNPVWVDGISGKCLNFDGTGDYISAALGFTAGQNVISSSCWIFVSSLPSVSKGVVNADNYRYSCSLQATGVIRYGAWTSYTNEAADSTGTITTGQWNHVVVVNDFANHLSSCYINGVFSGSSTLQGNSLEITAFTIGRKDTGGTTNFIGLIDEVRIYNVALTEKEVQALFLYINPNAKNVITAQRIAANSITAAEILAGTITATQIDVDTITSLDNLVIGSPQVLIDGATTFLNTWLSYKGTYASGTTYKKGDQVLYLTNYWNYINTTPGSGHTPADDAYWDPASGNLQITTIDGGTITANTITTTNLNFTPVQSTDVIAKINASAEGITIDADNLTINSTCTFAAGYNPTSKVTTFAQDAIPTSVTTGDIWIDTNDDNKTYRAASAGADEIKAGEWILLETTKVKTFAQDAIPTSLNAGDIWIDTNDNNKMYRATNAGDDEIKAGEWVAVPDNNKLNAVGGAYDSAASGARVRIFPDANTGIQVIDDGAADVFKVIVGGTDVGDVIIGNYAGGQGIKYDKSAATTTFQGIVSIGSGNAIFKADSNGIYLGNATFASAPFSVDMVGALKATSATITGAITAGAGSSLPATYLSGNVDLDNTNISAQGWTNICVFSAIDYRIVAWADGVITTAAGTAYNITGANTGNMNASTSYYIYLDIAVSTTLLQVTATAATAIGSGKILVATAYANPDTTSKAQYQVFGGVGGVRLFVDNISANSASTNEFISNSAQIANLVVTDAKINTMSANKIIAGTGIINSLSVLSTLTMGSAGVDGYIQSHGWDGVENGFQIKGGATPSITIIGGTIKTASSGKRLELSSSTIQGYNASNNGTLTLGGNSAQIYSYADGALPAAIFFANGTPTADIVQISGAGSSGMALSIIGNGNTNNNLVSIEASTGAKNLLYLANQATTGYSLARFYQYDLDKTGILVSNHNADINNKGIVQISDYTNGLACLELNSSYGNAHIMFTGGVAFLGLPTSVLDSYSESNRSSDIYLSSTEKLAVSQSFTAGATLNIGKIKLYLKKIGSPTGNITVKIFAHSGTYGTNSVPTGAALATSDVVSISSLTTSYQLIDFFFNGVNQISLTNTTQYVLVVYYSGGDISNDLYLGTDSSTPSHGGNWATSTDGTTFSADSNRDVCFYVYGLAIPDGAMWYDGTHLYFQKGAATITIT